VLCGFYPRGSGARQTYAEVASLRSESGFQFYGTTIIGGTAGHGAVFKVIDKVTN
jgi:hypothetical protein